MQVRFTIVTQYVTGALLLADRAKELEGQLKTATKPTRTQLDEYRALVVGAVLQAAAAIEGELGEVLMHGPKHLLGGNAPENAEAVAFLAPLRDVIDRTSGVLERWNLVLHLLRKPMMITGAQPYQDAAILIAVRNELVHYKSHWVGNDSLLDAPKKLKFAVPPFVSQDPRFPLQYLSAALAQWAHLTARDFLAATKAILNVT
jgi:hypothetical protein